MIFLCNILFSANSTINEQEADESKIANNIEIKYNKKIKGTLVWWVCVSISNTPETTYCSWWLVQMLQFLIITLDALCSYHTKTWIKCEILCIFGEIKKNRDRNRNQRHNLKIVMKRLSDLSCRIFLKRYLILLLSLISIQRECSIM